MSKLHSTLSRRDFMKGLGLAGAGLGAVAASAPVFHDVDELTSLGSNVNRYPWYVKEREFKNPTVEIDWNVLSRQNANNFKSHAKPTPADYDAAGVVGRYMYDLETPAEALILYDYCEKEFPGWDKGWGGSGDVRTTALDNACKFMMMGMWPGDMYQGGKRINVRNAIIAAGGTGSYSSFLGPQCFSIRPQDVGASRWQGTPEENYKTVRNAFRFLGAQDVGCAEIDSDTVKFFHRAKGGASGMFAGQGDAGGKQVAFKDIDVPYETGDEYAIPNKCKYIITFTARQSFEGTRRQAGITEGFAVWYSYARYIKMMCHMQEFIRGLGYDCLNMSGLCFSNPLSAITGLGEHGRMSSPTIHPKNGTTNRANGWAFLTDMPIAPTKPIDFGAYKFCETCGICADSCPFGIIQKGPSTWENPDAAGNGLAQGQFRGWRTDNVKCPHCPTCQGTCPFNSTSESFIHDMVKVTTTNLPLFNGFFANMERFMEYGRKPQWEFWDIEQPTYGFDTTA
ncbi:MULTISPECIES: reductive dehalogenase [Dehalococcoides]|uniref:Reductive dehalogenase n=3 Tax=Bacteria TaxID=2 RepID=A0A142VBR0_9CHLR|nr:reductive dehalogenase [Dehalococcoides mccartyi]AII61471.1 dehalogenase [Dehalococcoides mccartyi CG5]AMU87254.1 reductive dehalogenase [Dehalococcoides mccartyi]AQU06479.1 reductive dehalogenase [Dehalococcoides mccartyi]AQU07921.1 reductive dehalogenase [Dehalococcoides mccartyi]AQX73781.1 reductive dehalogenase [Dehalococcoides mccartyi]